MTAYCHQQHFRFDVVVVVFVVPNLRLSASSDIISNTIRAEAPEHVNLLNL